MLESSSLQVLIAVEKSETLSKAAEHLNITQSAVSQSIKALEVKVGFKVITRQGKKVVLTPEARKLAKLGKQYFKRFDDVISEIRDEKNKIIGDIHLGTLIGIGKSWIASRMTEFSSHFPDLAVKCTLDFPEKLIKGFENHDISCLVLPEHLVPASAERKELHDEHSTLVFPDSDQFKIDEEISLKNITDYPIIFFQDNDPLFYQWCREKFGSVPRNVQPRLVVNSFGHMLQAVHEGVGIAVIPLHVFKRSYFKDKVKTLGKGFDILNDRFCFAYHADAKESVKVQTLYDFLKKGSKEYH